MLEMFKMHGKPFKRFKAIVGKLIPIETQASQPLVHKKTASSNEARSRFDLLPDYDTNRLKGMNPVVKPLLMQP